MDARRIALELNDAALAVASDAGLLHIEPGYVVVEREPLVGAEAVPGIRRLPHRASFRHWHTLSTQPLSEPLGTFGSTADIVQLQLERLWRRSAAIASGSASDAAGPDSGSASGPASAPPSAPASGATMDPAATPALALPPAAWTAPQLALFLQLAARAGIGPVTLIDPAVAMACVPAPGRELMVLDAGLHALTLTQIRQGAEAEVGERDFVPQLGVEALLRVATDAIARRFIECSRFDPLHDPGSEQAVHDRLPAWLDTLARDAEATLTLATPGGAFSAVVPAIGFRQRMGGTFQPLIQRLRARVAARGPHALLVHPRLAAFPGVLEALLQLPATTVTVVEPGAAALGALRRVPRDAPAGLPVPLRSLPWASGEWASGEWASGERAAGESVAEERAAAVALAPKHRQAPTHLLMGDNLHRLGTEPFGIGTGLGEGEKGVTIPADMRGISRHHCSIRLENGVHMLFDHSRFGTWLNGHRIEGGAVLEAGDVITLGTPPIALRLLAEVPDDGAP